METSQILVHIEGKIQYCELVIGHNMQREQLPQIANVALSRYNSIHLTTYDLSQASLFLVDSDDTIEIPIENFSEDLSSYELIIRLPDFRAFNSQYPIVLEEDEKLANMSKQMMQKKDFYSAYTFACYSPGHVDELASKTGELLYSNLNICETKDFQFLLNSNHSFQELLTKCEENCDNIMMFRKYCLEVAAINPKAAIRIIMNFPFSLKILPEFCQTQELFNFALSEMKQLCITSAGFRYFSDLFFDMGFVEESSFIYNHVEIPAAGSGKEIRQYLWKLFLLFDLQKLHQALVIYFSSRRNYMLGSLRCDKIYTYLCDVYTGIPTPESSFHSSQLEIITDKMHAELCHIYYMAGLLLFYTGMYDHFHQVFQTSPYNDPIILLKMKPSAREWKLGRAIMLNQGWGCETIPKNKMNCVLADYQPYKENFVVYSIIRPHDVYLLSHCSFYEVASPEPSFAKKCFWNLIEVAKQYNCLTIMNGNYDVKTVIPHMLQNIVFSTVTECIEAIAQSVIVVFQQIHEYLPQMSLIFIEIAPYDHEGHIVAQLNSLISQMLPEFVTFKELPNEEEQPNDSVSVYGSYFPA